MEALADNPLIRKLRWSYALESKDRERLEELCRNQVDVEGRHDLISEGDKPECVHLVMKGLACRYKVLPSGRRSIMALLIPGDFCDLHVAILGEMDHTIATITDSTIVRIPRAVIDELIETHANVTKALWWATLVDEGTLREWLANMGRRPSDKQMAHFFCEMFTRMAAVGLAEEGRYFLPLTQEDLGDVLGISTVHVNRTIQRLREMELLELSDREVLIKKPDRLIEFAEFDPNYLHLTQPKDA